MPTGSESSNSNLVFTGCLPLAWQALPRLPEPEELQHLEQTNLHILHILFALDIHAGDHADDPMASSGASELKRLDFKVSLLLEIVGQLFSRQHATPPEHLLTLTIHDLIWRTETRSTVGTPIRLELYCNLSYPRPLILHAHVNEIISTENDHQIRAILHQPSEPLREALERYIFLQHRRAVANRRGNSQR
ncbi:MAG: PilZ domain-containing protein [Gammaproteobacteria bacterium]|nr:PilZ domain-containing protein [Gammaproteobacteria bacterium]